MTRLPLLIAACVTLAACSPPSPATTTAASPAASDPTGSITTPETGSPDTELVGLLRVIDGDTIEVDTGNGIESVRLIGINAPERDECHGDTARGALEEMLSDATTTLESGTSTDRDGFGRMLRYVAADGADVNAQLLRGGHALALQTEHPRLDAYVDAADSAAASGTGLWRADRCGEPASEPLVISDFEANPSGPDDDPVTGEYVVIARWADGSESLDLAGWMLRDESSVHRYEFPDVGILPTQEYTVRTGCGTDHGFELFWCADGPVWSNRGDTIILLDPAGNVVDHLTYRG
jgi:endonuclease YncB( thermonuclease family)